jgi:hypothetical protein
MTASAAAATIVASKPGGREVSGFRRLRGLSKRFAAAASPPGKGSALAVTPETLHSN